MKGKMMMKEKDMMMGGGKKGKSAKRIQRFQKMRKGKKVMAPEGE